jgi:hypothetical protein
MDRMKKLGLIFAIVALPVTALALDTSFTGSLNPDETRKIFVQLEKGNNQVDVSTEEYSLITCTFFDPSSGMKIVEERRMLCRGYANLNSPAKLVVDVHNLEAKAHTYRVRINNEVHGK